MPATTNINAATLSDRVSSAIGALTQEGSVRVTASVGVACWPRDAESAEALVDVADRRQYEMKTARAVRRGA